MPSPRSHSDESRRSAAPAQPAARGSSSERERFRAAIYRVGPNYCVDVPAEASRALAGDPPARHPRVEGLANGHPLRTRLTPRGGGAHRLFLASEVRAAAGVGDGDTVEIEVWPAAPAPAPALPADLASALAALPGGLEAFASLTEAQREGMVALLERARTPETRARYLARVVEEVRRRLEE